MDFAELIKRHRIEAGKRPEDVAAHLECSVATVRGYEAGTSMPRVDRAVKLMRYLDIDMLEGVRAVGGDL